MGPVGTMPRVGLGFGWNGGHATKGRVEWKWMGASLAGGGLRCRALVNPSPRETPRFARGPAKESAARGTTAHLPPAREKAGSRCENMEMKSGQSVDERIGLLEVPVSLARQWARDHKAKATQERVKEASLRDQVCTGAREPWTWRNAKPGMKRRVEGRREGAKEAREMRLLEGHWQGMDEEFEGTKGDVVRHRTVKVWSAGEQRFVTWAWSAVDERWMPIGVRSPFEARSEVKRLHGEPSDRVLERLWTAEETRSRE